MKVRGAFFLIDFIILLLYDGRNIPGEAPSRGHLRMDVSMNYLLNHAMLTSAKRIYRIEDISHASAYIANPVRDLYRCVVSLRALRIGFLCLFLYIVHKNKILILLKKEIFHPNKIFYVDIIFSV